MKAIRLGGGGAAAGGAPESNTAAERRAKLELDLCDEAAVALAVPPHARVVTLRFLTPDPSSPRELLVFSDYVAGGTLANLLSSPKADRADARGALYKRPRRDVAAVAERLTAQLFEALAHCHASGIVHGDVKPENLLIDGSAAELRLADFGLAAADGGARRHGDGVPRVPLAGCTRTYASPETFRLLGLLAGTRNPCAYAALKRDAPATPATTDLWAAALVALQVWGGPVADLGPWDHGRGDLGGAGFAAFCARPLALDAVAAWDADDVADFLDDAGRRAARRDAGGAVAWAPDGADARACGALAAAVRAAGAPDGRAVIRACAPPYEDSARAFARAAGLKAVAAARLRGLLRRAFPPFPLGDRVRATLAACLASSARDRPPTAADALALLSDRPRDAPPPPPRVLAAPPDGGDGASRDGTGSETDSPHKSPPAARARLSYRDASLINLGNTLARGFAADSFAASLRCFARVGSGGDRGAARPAAASAAAARGRATRLAKQAARSLRRSVEVILGRSRDWFDRGAGWRSRAAFHLLRLARPMAALARARGAESAEDRGAAILGAAFAAHPPPPLDPPDRGPRPATAGAAATPELEVRGSSGRGLAAGAPPGAVSSPGESRRARAAATVEAAERRLLGAKFATSIPTGEGCVFATALRLFLRAAALLASDEAYPSSARDALLALQEGLELCEPPPDAKGKAPQAALEAFYHLQQGVLRARETALAGVPTDAGAAKLLAPLWLLESSRIDRWGRRRRIPLRLADCRALEAARARGARSLALTGGRTADVDAQTLRGAGDARGFRLARVPPAPLPAAGTAAAHAAFATDLLGDAVRRADVPAVTELSDDESFPASWAPAVRAWLRGARDSVAAPPPPPASPGGGGGGGGGSPSARPSAAAALVAARAASADDASKLLEALGVDVDLALRTAVATGDAFAVLNVAAARPDDARGFLPRHADLAGRADALLLSAVERGDARAVDALVRRCGVAADGGSGGVGPIHVAASRNSPAVVDALAVGGADLEAARPAADSGPARTPLAHAAAAGAAPALAALLRNGAAAAAGGALKAAVAVATAGGSSGASGIACARALVAAGASAGALAVDVGSAAADSEATASAARKALAALADAEALERRVEIARTAADAALDATEAALGAARPEVDAARRFLARLCDGDVSGGRAVVAAGATTRLRAVTDAAAAVGRVEAELAGGGAAALRAKLLAMLPAARRRAGGADDGALERPADATYPPAPTLSLEALGRVRDAEPLDPEAWNSVGINHRSTAGPGYLRTPLSRSNRTRFP